MKRTITIAAAVMATLLVLVFTGGCLGQRVAEKVTEKAIEKAIEKESGGNVDVDLEEGEVNVKSDDGEVNISSDDDSVEIKSDEGEATFGAGSDLPEGFPGDVPVYDNMTITTSWKSTEDGKNNYSITAMTEDSVDDVFDWYKGKLDGWDIEGEMTFDSDEGKTSSLGAGKGEMELQLMVMSSDEGTTVVLTVTE